jgi:FtsP/CotA-like multicopper oxidase with cupredoxin domain
MHLHSWLASYRSRRSVLWAGVAAVGGSAHVSRVLGHAQNSGQNTAVSSPDMKIATPHPAHGAMLTVGEVDSERNGFDPSLLLTDWYTGMVSVTPDGRRLRTFEITAEDKEIEIAPGVAFPAWTYNGRIPGPSLRATEGDRLRITFRNSGSHPHSMHFHGIHSAKMDGIPGAGLVGPGDEFVYEFDAKPFGCHLYHCHALPLKRHIHKGMYGAFIVDPDPVRHPQDVVAAQSRLRGSVENSEWQEFVMVMNAFDTNFDGENEFYAVNTVAHAYAKSPIKLVREKPVRIYLVNVTEFDPINSFHLHGNFFDYFDQGTTLTPTLRTVDLITQCQAQRGILEFTFRDHEPGLYMFHAHQSEFTELGWMGMFDVVDTLS